MKLNTVIKLADGRIGTVCYNHIDGWGGVWGERHFDMPEGGFGALPVPEWMMRGSKVQEVMQRRGDELADAEFLGEPSTTNFEIVRQGDGGRSEA